MVAADDQEYAGAGPGGDLRQVNAPDAHDHREQQHCADPHEQLDEARNHGDHGIPQPLQRGAVNEQQIEHRQAARHHPQEIVSDGWYLLPNHNGTPISLAYLQDYVRLVEEIYAGTAVIEDKLNHRFIEMDPKAPELCRVRCGACSIFIKKAELLKVYGTN